MTALLTALVLLAQSHGAQPSPQGGQFFTYWCSGGVNLPGQPSASVSLSKVFLEDGSVHHQSVDLYENASFIRSREASDRIAVSLKWPAENDYRPGRRPFSWANGSIRITLLTDAALRHGPQEIWQQTIFDRDSRASVYEQNGMRLLLPPIGDVFLATPQESPTSGGSVIASIDSLLAWGHGVDRLTGYFLFLERRRYRPNEYPNDGVGQRRIVGQYEIDMAGFARRVAQVREAATAWERSLGDFHACRRQVEDADAQIVIPTERIRRPGR